MIDIKEIAYSKDGIMRVIKLPFTLSYENLDKDSKLTREQSESIMVDVLEYIRENCEIRRKRLTRRKKGNGRKKGG